MPEGEPLNPYHPPLQNEPLRSDLGSRIPLFCGVYFTLLGWASLALLIFVVFRSGYTSANIIFIVWLWMGWALRRRFSVARLFAIIAFWIVFLMSALVLAGQVDTVNLGHLSFPGDSTEAFLIQAAMLIIFGIPGILLMTPAARRAFTDRGEIGQ